MRGRRILILHQPGLLAEGLRGLLEQDDRLEIISIAGDSPRLAALVGEIRPDVLVVEGNPLSLWLGDPPQAIPLECISLVISLAGNDNRMRIYRIEEQSLTALQELVETLAGRQP